MSKFHYPYHFVPVKKAGRSQDLKLDEFLQGKDAAVGHDRYAKDAHSGRIVCRLSGEGPFFVGARRSQGATRRSPAQVDPFELDRQPAIPASSLRGLISSLAEAASNSALRVLENRIYSRRAVAVTSGSRKGESLSAIGMIVAGESAEGAEGAERLQLRPLTLPTLEAVSEEGDAELPSPFGRMFPRPNLKVYIGDVNSIRSESFDYSTYSESHGSPKFYGLKLVHPERAWNDSDGQPNLAFDEGQHRRGCYLLSQKVRSGLPMPWDSIPDAEKPGYTRGILRILGCDDERDIPKTKKHELFIPYSREMEQWDCIPIPQKVIDCFHDLADQRTASRREGPALPFEPRGAQRNRCAADENRFRLKPGDLVYFNASARGTRITEISLSSIWRKPLLDGPGNPLSAPAHFAKVDPELLPFHPGRETLTLAERIFGFVSSGKAADQEAALALAGRVRFSHARFSAAATDRSRGDSRPAAERGQRLESRYLPAVTLRILDSPKPPSPSLYFRNRRTPADGPASEAHISKFDLNLNNHEPQGRKFYLHHRPGEVRRKPVEGGIGGPPWATRHEDPGDPQSRLKQKVRITPLPKDSTFHFHVDFDNLRPIELGLLLYALRPSRAFRHKLGMGKPIGLGTVRIDVLGLFEVDRRQRYSWDGFFEKRYSRSWLSDEADRDNWPQPYRGLTSCQAPQPFRAEEWQRAFLQGIDPDIQRALELLGDPSALKAAVGLPLVEGGDPELETFKWFVANEKPKVKKRQHLKPLDTLERDAKMPLLTSVPEEPDGERS